MGQTLGGFPLRYRFIAYACILAVLLAIGSAARWLGFGGLRFWQACERIELIGCLQFIALCAFVGIVIAAVIAGVTRALLPRVLSERSNQDG